MREIATSSSSAGLERLCEQNSLNWISAANEVGGVELFEARFQGHPYQKHRHDTYAISLTETGVLEFAYRGATHVSIPGMVVVLHPDEAHDGYAGAESGFGYRELYVEPAQIFEAVRQLSGRACSLPFLRDPVVSNHKLATAIRTAFQHEREPLAIDDVVLQLVEGLIDGDPSCARAGIKRHLDVAAVERAREFL